MQQGNGAEFAYACP